MLLTQCAHFSVCGIVTGQGRNGPFLGIHATIPWKRAPSRCCGNQGTEYFFVLWRSLFLFQLPTSKTRPHQTRPLACVQHGHQRTGTHRKFWNDIWTLVMYGANIWCAKNVEEVVHARIINSISIVSMADYVQLPTKNPRLRRLLLHGKTAWWLRRTEGCCFELLSSVHLVNTSYMWYSFVWWWYRKRNSPVLNVHFKSVSACCSDLASHDFRWWKWITLLRSSSGRGIQSFADEPACDLSGSAVNSSVFWIISIIKNISIKPLFKILLMDFSTLRE